MKSFFVLALITGSLITVNAQFKFKSCGQLQIGNESADVSNVPLLERDTISRIQVFGPFGDMGEGGRLSFGDAASAGNLNVLIGELGTADCDKLWLHGKRGTYITSTATASDTIAFFDVEKGRYFQFNCDVKTTGVFVRSDSKFKNDIKPLTNTDKLWELNAVSYKLKPDKSGSPISSVSRNANAITSSKDEKDRAFFEEYYRQNQNQRTRYGFVAQEVNEIYPELVQTDSLGYMYVDYMGMIPLLVNAVKELKAKTDSLENVITNTRNLVHAKSLTSNNADINALDALGCELFQNLPNPFNETTFIKCNIPQNIQKAELIVFNMQGTTIAQRAINERGVVSVQINGNELESGMYIYSLICDGNEIDSKRMILTK